MTGKITRDDRIVIKALTGGKELELSPLSGGICQQSLVWCRSSLGRLIKTIDAGLDLPVDGVIGRGRRRPVRTAANVARVEELISSQEDEPGTHKSPRDIERQTSVL